MNAKQFDVIIVGGGIGGMMAAYKLASHSNTLSIAILQRGKTIQTRACPSAKSGIPCAHCKVCDITSGYAGAGAFSDGKFNLGTSYGGTLGQQLGEYRATQYIQCVDNILEQCYNGKLSDYPKIYKSNEQLKKRCLQNNLQLLDMDVRHLGTDLNAQIMQSLYRKLEQLDVKLFTGIDVTRICKMATHDKQQWLIQTLTQQQFNTQRVIIATGRGGTPLVTQFCEQNKILMRSNAVDIGVRVEMKDAVWSHFSDKIYEPKILCRTKTFEDKTRMFCFNKGGIVSVENNNGVITANGHSNSDKGLRTDNCNFAILTSIRFTQPFNKPTDYARYVSSLANMIGQGNVVVQRFGDLIRGRRTTQHRLAQNSVKPTLKATPGDISLVLPHRILTDIIETIEALNKVAPGTSNDDTLLYACESKYYSVRPEMSEDFELTSGVWVVGDCSGICRGLSQSGAMGLYVADAVIRSLQQLQYSPIL